ncbi:hypothetical protein [Dyadobacter psychrotolerans]|uniref:Uncharacterized protein n=1 Tax=Dyadobacter psychrotolerans TaxID=2541721 RepID=A0A4R5D7U4_9BACT|nr:hypothetical protein [Dyadobacter psychrotolerans]TDE09599.1 hypothetical protein E0F88_30390 [Dyadobacter psychrotolerans]
MKENYDLMLIALNAASLNVDNLLTATEITGKVNLLDSPHRSIEILNQTMALRDCCLRLRELLTVVSGRVLEWDLPKKEVILFSAKHFKQYRTQYLNHMEYLGNEVINTYFFTPYLVNIKLEDHLIEITNLCNQLAIDHLNEK